MGMTLACFIGLFSFINVNAATLEVASVNNRGSNPTADINYYINSVVYKPSVIDYSIDISKQYLFNDLGNVQEWMYRNYHNFYEVNIDITFKISNLSNSLVETGQDILAVLPTLTWSKSPICYAIEDLSNDFDIYSVWNGEIRYRPVDPDMIYNYHVAFPAKSATILQFRIHAYYSYDSFSDIYGGTYYGTQFDSSATYVTVTDLSAPQPSTFTRIDSVIAQKSSIFNFQKIFDGFTTTFDYLSNIYNQLRGQNQNTGSVTNGSSSLDTQTSSMHSQEQAYFDQNTQAIAATGLSNYNMTQGMNQGVTAVSNDFMSLWNALGGWNGLYIFSLTLTLALKILRHTPSIINSRKNQYKGDNS